MLSTALLSASPVKAIAYAARNRVRQSSNPKWSRPRSDVIRPFVWIPLDRIVHLGRWIGIYLRFMSRDKLRSADSVSSELTGVSPYRYICFWYAYILFKMRYKYRHIGAGAQIGNGCISRINSTIFLDRHSNVNGLHIYLVDSKYIYRWKSHAAAPAATK